MSILTLFRNSRASVAPTELGAQVAVAVADVAEVPELKPVKFNEADEAILSDWIKVANELGLTHGKVAEMELKVWLQAEGIPLFSTQAVFDYLTSRAEGEGSQWEMWPLRQSDIHETPTSANVTAWPAGHGRMRPRPYYGPVPYPVLLTAKRIHDRFGSEAQMYVAALKSDDPFLAVRFRLCSIQFVERWDEPGFRDR